MQLLPRPKLAFPRPHNHTCLDQTMIRRVFRRSRRCGSLWPQRRTATPPPPRQWQHDSSHYILGFIYRPLCNRFLKIFSHCGIAKEVPKEVKNRNPGGTKRHFGVSDLPLLFSLDASRCKFHHCAYFRANRDGSSGLYGYGSVCSKTSRSRAVKLSREVPMR